MSSKLAIAAALLALAGCSDREMILPGERENVRSVLSYEPETTLTAPGANNASRPAVLGQQRSNGSWTQSHAIPYSRTDHALLNASIRQAWSTNIGQGDKRRARITADPVAANGRIFTLDSAASVSATSENGESLWQVDLTPSRDRSDQATGGALTYGDGTLFVTSAFGEVVALNPENGTELWRQKLLTTGTGTPTYYDGLLYLVAGDSTAWAIETKDGRIRWQIDGVADSNNVTGGPAPVVTDQYAVFSFGSGDMMGTFRQGGLRLWNARLAGRRAGFALGNVDDITGDPVAYGGTLYAGNATGDFVALGLANGTRLWSAKMGASGPAWVTADSVYVVSDRNALVRLDSATGEQIWQQELPGYIDRRRAQKRRDRSFVNHGPVLAGGRLVVASSDGNIRHFAPEDGTLLGTTPVQGGATTQPIVVNGTLYVVSSRGELVAFR